LYLPTFAHRLVVLAFPGPFDIPLVGISPLLIVSPFGFSDRPFDSPDFRSKALNQFAEGFFIPLFRSRRHP
jgi:hypothetical protein